MKIIVALLLTTAVFSNTILANSFPAGEISPIYYNSLVNLTNFLLQSNKKHAKIFPTPEIVMRNWRDPAQIFANNFGKNFQLGYKRNSQCKYAIRNT